MKRMQFQAGAIIFCRSGERLLFALGKTLRGYWHLPKGDMEPGETPEERMLLEVKQEINLEREGLRILRRLENMEYYINRRKPALKRWRVLFLFLVESPTAPTLTPGDKFTAAGWYSIAALGAMETHGKVYQRLLAVAAELDPITELPPCPE